MTKSKVFHRSSRLARKLVIYVVLASTFITVFTSGFQLYEIYSSDVGKIDKRLQEIGDTYVDTISSRVWVASKQELDRDVENLLRLPDIAHVKIYEGDKLLAEAGQMPSENMVEKKYPLMYTFRGKQQKIGVLHVAASLKNAYQHILDQALAIVVGNALKTFLISGFMLFLFYHLIARHLHKIAEYAETVSIDNLDRVLVLDRPENQSDKQDEFDVLVDSFHLMQRNIINSVSLLTKSERNLSQTLNSIGDAVIATDDRGCITRMNPIAENLTAWSITEAKGKRLAEVFPIINAVTRKSVISPVDQVLKSGKIVGLANHTILLARDGEEYQIADSAAPILDSKNHIIGVILVFRNVTEEYALQESIKNNEAHLQAIMNNSPAAICVKDLDGKFMMINREYEKLLGITNEEIKGKTTYDVFPETVAEDLVNNDQDVIASQLSLHSEEKIPHADSMHLYSSTKFCLFDSDAEPYAICSISTDVTEQRKQSEMLRRTQKMDALGKLTGGVAHDFNNMLNVIIGYSEILSRNLDDDSSNQHFAKEIKEAGQRGAALTRKLLSFSGQTSSTQTQVNINEILHEDLNMLKKTLTARIHVNLKLDNQLWLVLVDKGELEDVILNLSINAMHAMPSGGKLTYLTLNENLSLLEADNLGLEGAGEYVRLSLIDTGIGMDEQTVNKIFDPFFTTKGERGTGLGLSQVFGFVERSNGVIKVYSEVGVGTEFTMYFPRSYSDSDIYESDNSNTVDNDSEKYHGNETLLLVDDEKALLTLGEDVFSQQGYKVFCAENADSALWILSRNKIDVMISDVIMPGIDGYELARKVEQLYPEVKVQLVSGYSSERLGKEKENPYTKTIIDKPYSTEEILARVRHLLDDA